MKSLKRSSFILLLLLAQLVIVDHAFAGAVVSGAISGALNTNTIPSSLMPGSMAALLCGFRWLFCGQVLLVIVATAVFVMGLLLMSQKLTWQYALLIIVFTSMLTMPEKLVIVVVHSGEFFGLNLDFLDVFAKVCTCKTAPPQIF